MQLPALEVPNRVTEAGHWIEVWLPGHLSPIALAEPPGLRRLQCLKGETATCPKHFRGTWYIWGSWPWACENSSLRLNTISESNGQ